MNKFLSVALIAAIASYASVDAKYVPGFKLGVDFGASFNKYKVDGKIGKAHDDFKTLLVASATDTADTKGSKSRTSFEGALKVGYEFLACDSVIAGADLGFGYNFAGKAKLYGTKDAKKAETNGYMQIKKKFEIEFAPKIGFKMTDDFVGFVKLVADMSNYKMKIYDKDNKAGNFSKSKTKFTFGIGADLEYHFDNCLAATFGYTYLFKTKLLKADIDNGENKNNPKYTNAAHKIALGLKYTFA